MEPLTPESLDSEIRIRDRKSEKAEIRVWPCALIFPYQNVKCLLQKTRYWDNSIVIRCKFPRS